MPSYPGDPAPTLTPSSTLQKEGYADHLILSTMHVGTHIDAPMHMISGGKSLPDIPIEKFFGRGVLLDVRGRQFIDADAIKGIELQAGDIVLLLTGWSQRYRTADYFDNYPNITETLAQRFIHAKIGMIGLDAPSPDRPPFGVHKLLLAHEILIAENLTNLEALLGVQRFEIIALPVKFAADAGLARVAAICHIA